MNIRMKRQSSPFVVCRHAAVRFSAASNFLCLPAAQAICRPSRSTEKSSDLFANDGDHAGGTPVSKHRRSEGSRCKREARGGAIAKPKSEAYHTEMSLNSTINNVGRATDDNSRGIDYNQCLGKRKALRARRGPSSTQWQMPDSNWNKWQKWSYDKDGYYRNLRLAAIKKR